MTFLDFPRLHLTGGVYKSVRFSCEIFSGFNVPKIIKLGFLLTELFKKIKRWTFFSETVYIYPTTVLLCLELSLWHPSETVTFCHPLGRQCGHITSYFWWSFLFILYLFLIFQIFCLQCFEAVGWAAGRASGL